MRLAMFGGTFDPIHQAHVEIASEAADAFDLDQILFIPAANPPHKHTGTSYEHRFRMVELACVASGDPEFIPSRLEEGVEKSYSILTIERLKADPNRDGDKIFFIIGADAFAEIQSWYRWQDIVSAVTFIVVTRPGHTYVTPSGSRVLRLDTVAMPVSSSEIRAQLGEGRMPNEVPVEIRNYIRQHGLYGFFDSKWPTFLKSSESFESFIDSWQNGTLPKAEWTHTAHIAVGAWFTIRYPKDAFQRMSSGIVRHNAAVGTPNNDTSGYHATLTQLWLKILAKLLAGDSNPLDAARHACSVLTESRELHRQYYSFDVVQHIPARRAWVEPDRDGPFSL